ncbi:hypothetical protein NSS79_10625 [Paenibacillus sp. FSL L8-0436]|uniref:hypothetical protein n=1 Tax=Paenibacillus sp. FSL L8-0436 TaxID=2954686 RepID=UPI0031584322
MQTGDRVTAREPLSCTQMFYGKADVPKEAAFNPGAAGTVESAWPSGAGIVQMDGGPRVMVLDLAARFMTT